MLLISSCLLFVDASRDRVLHAQSITASNTIISAGNHISSNGNTSATFLDSGNLVLRDETSSDLLRESFDYPSHTLLPGMKLSCFNNWINWMPCSSLMYWKSREDPSPRVFSLENDPLGMHQFFIIKGSRKHWTSGGNFSCCRGLKLIINGICCGDMAGGCARKAPLQCSNKSQANGKKDQFLWMSKVRLLVNPIILQHRGASDCKSVCLSNCSCSAYAYGSDGCLVGAWDLWKSGMGQNLKDPMLGDIPSPNMLLRYINIGLLCVQESAANRPTMSIVVSMLSNELVLLRSPKQPAYSTITSVPDQNLCKSRERCSLTNVTVSILKPQ
ncbi:hypothetical protein TEA_013504 [Camellia sinensis var. sinensis]|uniref:Apple domain-containing protein n=1 Tax=Camellia sinensis var. sinensis TaxID=542762 RepID=A0A4S4EG36_CAMSN|nr:hypothetical protein TEA_013504 [Camellia sinensis var. sinensis]